MNWAQALALAAHLVEDCHHWHVWGVTDRTDYRTADAGADWLRMPRIVLQVEHRDTRQRYDVYSEDSWVPIERVYS